MKRTLLKLVCYSCTLLLVQTLFAWEYNEKDVVAPKIPDKLERVVLSQNELSGELNRRINDLIYKNFMVLDLDKDWLQFFQNRTDRNNAANTYFGIGKVMDAGTLFAKYTDDSAVKERTEYILDSILDTMDEDGYIGFWNREPNEYQNFVNWIVHEQEYFALSCVRHYRTYGSEKALTAAKRTVDFLIKIFPKNENNVYYIPSPISIAGVAEAAVELYRVTGEKKYFDFAENLQYEPHWFYEPFNSWRQNIESRPFHQYVMLSHLYPETERYRLTADPALLLKSDWMRHALLEKDYGALLVTGSSSSGEFFTRDQNGAGNIEESCVTAYLLRFFDSLMRLEGDMRYGDIMERAIYNALFAAQDPAGRKLRYFTAFSGERVYYPHDTFCCPGNFRRAVAEIPQKVYYRTDDGGIALNLYTQSSKTFDINGTELTLKQITNYPNSGTVEIQIQTKKPVETTLQFRTPRWADEMQIQVNQESPVSIIPKEQKNTSFTLHRNWQDGDSIKIEMPLSWRLIKGRMAQAGRVALLRGPVIYCIGAAKNPELISQVENLHDLIIDPKSLSEPEADFSTRPDGLMVHAKGWLPESPDNKYDIIFTEFPDETGREIYFRLPENSSVMPCDDELLDEPSTETRWSIEGALYGEPSTVPLSQIFNPTGIPLADLAADYVRPEGNTEIAAVWQNTNGTWSAWLCTGSNLDASGDSKFQLIASMPVYGTPNGYAYGSNDSDNLGFLADWNPSDQQQDNWRINFTDGIFAARLSEAEQKNYLLTHPVSDPNQYLIIRFTPNKPLADKPLFISGNLLLRSGSNGITLKVVTSNEGNKEIIFDTAVLGDTWLSIPVSSAKTESIDFILGNNGSHSCDSMALSLVIFEQPENTAQQNVKPQLDKISGDTTTIKIDNYGQFFSDKTDSPSKTLKLRLRNKITGEIQYRELSNGTDIEL